MPWAGPADCRGRSWRVSFVVNLVIFAFVPPVTTGVLTSHGLVQVANAAA